MCRRWPRCAGSKFTALAEVAAGEFVELVEQLLAEALLERLAGGVDVLHQLGETTGWELKSP